MKGSACLALSDTLCSRQYDDTVRRLSWGYRTSILMEKCEDGRPRVRERQRRRKRARERETETDRERETTTKTEIKRGGTTRAQRIRL